MKKVFLSLAVVFAVALSSCGGEKKEEGKKEEGEKPKVEEKKGVTGTFNVNKEESYISWKGWDNADPEGHMHFGKMKINDGEVNVDNGVITGGKFTFDVTSIYDVDSVGKTLDKLAGHFTQDDLFAQNSAGMPAFTITSVEEGVVKGDLVIAGKTSQVSMPANVEITENGVTAMADKTDLSLTDFEMPFFAPGEDGTESTFSTTIKVGLNIVTSK